MGLITSPSRSGHAAMGACCEKVFGREQALQDRSDAAIGPANKDLYKSLYGPNGKIRPFEALMRNEDTGRLFKKFCADKAQCHCGGEVCACPPGLRYTDCFIELYEQTRKRENIYKSGKQCGDADDIISDRMYDLAGQVFANCDK